MNEQVLLSKKHTPWGALCWAVPMLYLFFDPYQRRAEPLEWMVTGVVFVTFVALYIAGLRYWSDRRVLRNVCAAVLVLGAIFLAYRPSGAIFFPLVAAFAPFTVGGRLLASAGLIGAIVGVFGVECWLIDTLGVRDVPSTFALIFSIETVLISGGTTFAARQNRDIERFHRNDERERIARDLHDVLGQTLSSIALKSELAGRLFELNPQRARAEIGEVERISRQALDEVRQAIHGYHAGDIQSEFERAGSVLKAAGISAEQRCDTIEMDPARERVLALVLREAVTNVVRHARAKHCRLALQRTADACRLEVADDGSGGRHTEGIGIRSIRTRVEALGGTASWNDNAGTQVTVTLPLAHAEPA